MGKQVGILVQLVNPSSRSPSLSLSLPLFRSQFLSVWRSRLRSPCALEEEKNVTRSLACLPASFSFSFLSISPNVLSTATGMAAEAGATPALATVILHCRLSLVVSREVRASELRASLRRRCRRRRCRREPMSIESCSTGICVCFKSKYFEPLLFGRTPPG